MEEVVNEGGDILCKLCLMYLLARAGPGSWRVLGVTGSGEMSEIWKAVCCHASVLPC